LTGSDVPVATHRASRLRSGRGLTPVKAIAWPLMTIGVAWIAMRGRFARKLGAYCAMVAMLFGQFVLAAYACAAPRPIVPIPMVHMAMEGETGQLPCAAMHSPADTPQANACEVHCSDGMTSPGEPAWPPVTLAPLPVPTLALAELAAVDGAARTPLAPLSGAPPPTLQFCRLLI